MAELHFDKVPPLEDFNPLDVRDSSAATVCFPLADVRERSFRQIRLGAVVSLIVSRNVTESSTFSWRRRGQPMGKGDL